MLEDARALEIRHVVIGSQSLRVAVKRAPSSIPLIIFNGIGANLELLEGVAHALHGIEVVMFDVPGVGIRHRHVALRDLVKLEALPA